MSETKGHGYGWSDLHERPAAELAVGDTVVSPGLGAAYYTYSGGRVRGVGWMPPEGTAWTVMAREGNTTTCRSHDGRESTETFRDGTRVLVVESGGMVLRVGSHRARERLERALGRKPAAYFTVEHGGKFVVLYGDDVATALAITSITRTRVKRDDLGLCTGDDMHARRTADRVAGHRAAKETTRG